MIALRTKVFDDYVRAFLGRAPSGVIVNLGCGLDTRFSRLDNGACHWYELDLPEVIAIRKHFFKETDRYHSLPSSVLDFEWIPRLTKAHPHQPFLFLAEGLFMYLHDEDVKSIVLEIQAMFPGAEIVFETCSAWAVKVMEGRLALRKFQRRFQLGGDVTFSWGMENSRVPETWHSGIRLLDECFYLRIKEKKWGWYRFLLKIPRFGTLLWIGHYELK